jgi:hypothetical protein
MTRRVLFEGNNYIIREMLTSDGIRRYGVYDSNDSRLIFYTSSQVEMRKLAKKDGYGSRRTSG